MSVRRSFKMLAEGPLLILALALVGAICVPLWQTMTANEQGRPPFTVERLLRMLLGPEQIACYAAFAWAAFILLSRHLELRRQRKAFGLELLPIEEDARILPEDARLWQRRINRLSSPNGPFLLSHLLEAALSKFAITRSPQEAGDVIRSQVDVELGRLASSMATVNYLAWAIPALGFVGTVRGIGMALTLTANTDVELQQFMDITTRSLCVAFDTTLISLLLSLVLMFLLHGQQRGEEALVLDSQQYCLDHLLGRLYHLETTASSPTMETQRPEWSGWEIE
jgi:biopolymer transport protein ExbB/TolQ